MSSSNKPTMYWQLIPQLVAVVVHTDVAPTDEEWEKCSRDIAAQARTLKGALIYTASAGPSAGQRARTTEMLKAAGREDLSMTIMSGSRLVRGMATAFGWTMSGSLKVFSTHDFDGAISTFNMDNDEQIKVRLVLKQLARSAGIEIDAFADESGQFRRKFKVE